jgi:hypothetical protein
MLGYDRGMQAERMLLQERPPEHPRLQQARRDRRREWYLQPRQSPTMKLDHRLRQKKGAWEAW